MVGEAEKKCSLLQEQIEAARSEYEEGEAVMASLSAYYDDIASWVKMHDTASLEAKKVIVSCFIKGVEVCRGSCGHFRQEGIHRKQSIRRVFLYEYHPLGHRPFQSHRNYCKNRPGHRRRHRLSCSGSGFVYLPVPGACSPGRDSAGCCPRFRRTDPPVALEHLAALKGKGQKAVAVVVYGNRAYDDALLDLKDALEADGFQVIAAGAFVAEHSIARVIAAGRPDKDDLEKAVAFGAAVMEKVAKGENQSIQVPGDSVYREKPYTTTPVHPQANESCVRCGTCAKRCPMGAIPAENPSVSNGDRCINCMRCIAVCPQKARSLPAPMLEKVEGMLKEKTSAPRQPEIFL